MKLSDMNLLDGQVETITAMDLRRSPGDWLNQVALGKKLIVTRNGTPIAEITRPEPNALELGRALRALK